MTDSAAPVDNPSAPDSPAAITRTSVLAFFASDHAVIAPDAKVYINGGFFNLLRFPAFPATMPSLGVAVLLEIPFQDSLQDHSLRIVLRGPELQELPVRVEAQFRTAPTLESQFG